MESYRIIHTDKLGPVKFTNEFQEGMIADTVHCPKCRTGLLDGMWFMKSPNIQVGFECLSCHHTHSEFGCMFETTTIGE